MAKKRKKLSDQVRDAVATCGKTRYAIFKATGIDQAVLSRFMTGKGGMETGNLDKLADYLQLNIQKPKRKDK
jgi:hypothetical protein